jgi:hypothetical protein
MAIVNFAVTKSFDSRVKQLIKVKGFSSKAEFFRFAAIYLMDILDKPVVSEEEKFKYLTQAVSHEVARQFKGKKLPTVTEQLL